MANKSKPKRKGGNTKLTLRTQDDKKKFMADDIDANYPNLSPMNRMALLSMVRGMNICMTLKSPYEVYQFVCNKYGDLEELSVRGFQEYWESKGKEQLSLWSLMSGSLLSPLNYDATKGEFRDVGVELYSVGDMIRRTQTLFTWSVNVQCHRLEYNGDDDILADVMGMEVDDIKTYAMERGLNFGFTEFDFDMDTLTNGICLIPDDLSSSNTDGGYTLSAINYETDEEGDRVPATITAIAYEQLRRIIYEEECKAEDFKNFKVVGIVINSVIKGL